VLAAARVCFARHGYDQTTNKEIAAAAGVTPGAMYYWFPTKAGLFVAVYREVQKTVFAAWEQAIRGKETLIDKIAAVMDLAADMHLRDPSLAAFTAISPIEIQRHEDIRQELGDDANAVYRFFRHLIEGSHRDLPAEVSVDSVVNFLVAVSTGFSHFGATARSLGAHRNAIEVFKRIVAGDFFADESAEPRTRTRSPTALRKRA
jgi:AcrR family transcriptional regulator